VRALAIAATGMKAQQTNVEVIANNIANINTTGFKRSRAEFTDLLYQTERVAGAPNRGGQEAVPEGAHIGLGTRTAAVRNLHMQGSLTSTGNKLDLVTLGRTERYTVTAIQITTPEDVSVLGPTDTPSLTLVTCYPFYFVGSAPQRFIVRATISPASKSGSSIASAQIP